MAAYNNFEYLEVRRLQQYHLSCVHKRHSNGAVRGGGNRRGKAIRANSLRHHPQSHTDYYYPADNEQRLDIFFQYRAVLFIPKFG